MTTANTAVTPLENELYGEAAPQETTQSGITPLENDLYTGESSVDITTTELPKEHVLTGLLKSAGKGFISGGQGLLMTAQNAAELLGKLNKATGVNVEVPQDARNWANQLEQFKQEAYPAGNVSNSIPGKIVEGLTRLPSMITQVEAAGGGVGGFATLGAVNKQEGGAVEMAKGAVEGAVVGYIFKRAEGLKIAPRVAVGATVGAVQSKLAGSDNDQMIADAALNGGFMAAARPGVLKEVLEIPKDMAKTYTIVADTTSKVVGAVKKVPTEVGEFFGAIKKGGIARRELIGENANARLLQDDLATQRDINNRERFELEDITKQMDAEKIALDDQAASIKRKQSEGIDQLNLKNETKEEIYRVGKGKAETEKDISILQVKANVENERIKLEGEMEKHNQDIVNTAETLTKKIKSGEIQSFFVRLSKGYEAASEKIFSFIDQKSPCSRGAAIDMFTKVASEINERGGPIESSALGEKIAEAVKFCKEGGSQERMPEGFGGLSKDAQNQYYKQRGITPTDPNAPISFSVLRKMVKSITSSAEYGSYEADIMRKAFVEFTNDSIRAGGNPEASGSFQKLQQTMSDAISYKTKLARMFGVKGGTANWEGGAKALADVYQPKGATNAERIANRANLEAIKFLEKGNELAGGVGDITSQISSRAERLAKLEAHYAKLGDKDAGVAIRIAKEFNDKIASLDKQKLLTTETLGRETEQFNLNIQHEMAAGEMKYDLAIKALEGKRASSEKVVRKGKEFIIEKEGELRGRREQIRIREEAYAQRNKNLGLLRGIGFSMGAIGMWKVGRAFQAASNIAHYKE